MFGLCSISRTPLPVPLHHRRDVHSGRLRCVAAESTGRMPTCWLLQRARDGALAPAGFRSGEVARFYAGPFITDVNISGPASVWPRPDGIFSLATTQKVVPPSNSTSEASHEQIYSLLDDYFAFRAVLLRVAAVVTVKASATSVNSSLTRRRRGARKTEVRALAATSISL